MTDTSETLPKKSRRGVKYDLLNALRRNPTLIFAGDDICGKAADEIEALRTELDEARAGNKRLREDAQLFKALYQALKGQTDED